MRKGVNYKLHIAILAVFLLICGPARAAVDSYLDTFDNYADSATIDGVNYWKLLGGNSANAAAKTDATPFGSGKSLQLVAATPTTDVARSYAYGGLTPTWISFRAKAPAAGQNRSVPATGICAISFGYGKRLLANDGKNWVDTGKSFTLGRWYDVSVKLNFTNHTYDLYFTDTLNPDVQFAPIKTNLGFIDPSISSLSNLKFYGSYAAGQSADTYIDDISATYIDRLEIVTAAQRMLIDQPSGAMTAQLQNSVSAPQTAISDITLDFKSTSVKGSFSLTRDPWKEVTQVVLPKYAQSVTFYYKDGAVGKPVITVSEYPERGYTDATQEEEVLSEIAYFDIQAVSPQIAGQAFSLKITAKNQDGTVNDTYSGTAVLTVGYVSPGSGAYNVTPANISGFVKGFLEMSLVYPDSGLITITVTDSEDSSKTGTSLQVLFIPAFLTVEADPAQIVSKPFSLNVTAKNAQGAVTPNYNNKVNLYPVGVSPSDITGGLLTPISIEGSGFIQGVASANLTYNLYGTIKVKAEDSVFVSKTGVSNEISFRPKGLSITLDNPPGSRDFFYISEPVGISVATQDYLGNPIPNYSGAVELTSTPGMDMPAAYTFTAEDAGKHKFSAVPSQAGTYYATAQAEAGALSVVSPVINVKSATIQIIDSTSPIGTGQITVQIVDEKGNIIKSESSLKVVLKTTEEFENNTVNLPSGPITLNEGQAIVPITDTEAESVDIMPSTEFKITAKKGTVVFGKPGKGGIGTLMWRELKGKKGGR